MSVEEFSQLSYSEQVKQLDAVLKLPNWYEYEQAFSGSKVVSQEDGWAVFDKYGYLTFGYRGHLSRHKDYWKKGAGSQKANGGHGTWSPAYRSRAIKELEKAEDQIAGGKEAGKKQREQKAFIASLKEAAEEIKRLVINAMDAPEEQPTGPAAAPMLEQYQAGEFNSQDAETFKGTMQKVYDLGLPIDAVEQGAINWFDSNPESLAA